MWNSYINKSELNLAERNVFSKTYWEHNVNECGSSQQLTTSRGGNNSSFSICKTTEDFDICHVK